MEFGVHQKVSHGISLAFGKGMQGLKIEAMANQGKPNNNNQRKGLSGRALVESIMLGIFTIMVASVPVIVTRVPAPESLIIIKEILQDWCTPSTCFGVLIVGVLIVTFGGRASEPAATPEQNHKKYADSYLTQGPVSADQIDPWPMPDIFFSADTARTLALNHSAGFPVRVAQPSSVMVPVYYPAFVPQQPSPFSSHSEKEIDFLRRHDGRFESNGGERFVPKVDERLVPRVDDRFSPRVIERFSPRVEERFVPRVEECYSPKVEDRFGLGVEDLFSPRVKERFVPKVDERCVPRVEERYEPQEQDRFEAAEEDTYEPEEEVRYAYVESTARSDSEGEGRCLPVEDAESDFEDEVKSEHEARYIESEADGEGEAEPEVEMQSDSEDELEPYSHEFHLQQAPLPSESVDSSKVISPLHSPIAPPAVEVAPVHTQLSPSQRQSSNASSTVAPDVEAFSSLLSRPRPPIVPTSVIVQKAPPPPPPVSEPAATSSPEPKMSVRVKRKEPPEISPRTPPKHSNERRPFSSSYPRSYGEFVRRTIDCPLPTSKISSPSTRSKFDAAAVASARILPKVGSSPSPKTEAVETSLDERLAKVKAGRHSKGGISLMKQTSMPNKRPIEVRVVDDDKLDDKELTQDHTEDDDVDQRVEAFLKNFREQMRLQRQESLQRYRRGDIDL